MDTYVRAGLRGGRSGARGGSRKKRSTSQDPEPRNASRAEAADERQTRDAYCRVIAFVLERMAEFYDDEEDDEEEEQQPFCCAPGMVPSIEIPAYVKRLMTYTPWHNELYVSALLFVDRVLARNADVHLTRRSAHRLFASSVVVASKFLDDLYYTNRYFSTVAGVPVAELNALELELLSRTGFDTSAPQAALSEYLLRAKLLAAMALEHEDLEAFFGIDTEAASDAESESGTDAEQEKPRQLRGTFVVVETFKGGESCKRTLATSSPAMLRATRSRSNSHAEASASAKQCARLASQ